MGGEESGGRTALKGGAVIEHMLDAMSGEEANLGDELVVNGDEVSDDKTETPSAERPRAPYRLDLSGNVKSSKGAKKEPKPSDSCENA